LGGKPVRLYCQWSRCGATSERRADQAFHSRSGSDHSRGPPRARQSAMGYKILRSCSAYPTDAAHRFELIYAATNDIPHLSRKIFIIAGWAAVPPRPKREPQDWVEEPQPLRQG